MAGQWSSLLMAHRKKPGATISGMASAEHQAPAPRPCLASFPSQDSEDRQETETPEPAYCNEQEQPSSRPTSPDHVHSNFHGRPDSLDGDSSSDYVNNTSEDEEDYDEGLPEEDEGVTYYIRYCPEDDSYMEGTDCNEGCYGHAEPPHDTDDCQEAVEEWVEGDGKVRCEVLDQDSDQQLYDGRPEPVLDHHSQRQYHHEKQVPSRILDHDDDGDESEDYCPNEDDEDEAAEDQDREAYTGDYYDPEDNGNSAYPSHKVTEGETGEETEEDIDQIVAEIKMSMSMSSLNSGFDQSPDETAPVSGRYQAEAEPKPEHAPYQPPHRHDGRPKTLNIPPAAHNSGTQRGHRGHLHTPEERRRWAQEQVREQVKNILQWVCILIYFKSK